MKKNIAQIIRVLTIPPVVVCMFLLYLYFGREDVFVGARQLVLSLLFLMIMPILAYPISYIIPQLRRQGRDGQRGLAFVLSMVGYGMGLVYAIVFNVSYYLFLLFLTYFLSVIFLTILNKAFKIKASGHACSIVGPMTLIIYFLGPKIIIWCAVMSLLVIWSSLILKRHTMKDLVWGGLSSVAAFFISLLAAIVRRGF